MLKYSHKTFKIDATGRCSHKLNSATTPTQTKSVKNFQFPPALETTRFTIQTDHNIKRIRIDYRDENGESQAAASSYKAINKLRVRTGDEIHGQKKKKLIEKYT